MGNRNTTPQPLPNYPDYDTPNLFDDFERYRENSDGEYSDVSTLSEMEDGPDSWFNDPTISQSTRRMRLQARANRQNEAYRRNPNHFNRREWRQRDEAEMRELYDREVYDFDIPQRLQADPNNDYAFDWDRRRANLIEADNQGGNFRRTTELPQRRITIQSLIPQDDRDEPPTSQDNSAEPEDLDSDTDSSSDDASDVPSNFAGVRETLMVPSDFAGVRETPR